MLIPCTTSFQALDPAPVVAPGNTIQQYIESGLRQFAIGTKVLKTRRRRNRGNTQHHGCGTRAEHPATADGVKAGGCRHHGALILLRLYHSRLAARMHFLGNRWDQDERQHVDHINLT